MKSNNNKTLNMCLAASIMGCQFWELIGCLSVTFGGDPGSNVDDSLDGAYLELFNAISFKALETVDLFTV